MMVWVYDLRLRSLGERLGRADRRKAARWAAFFTWGTQTLAVINSKVAVAVATGGPAVVKTAAFMTLLGTAYIILKYLAIGSLIFCGGLWMFGQQGRAIERAIGVVLGTLLALFAPEIVEFLWTLKGAN
jgi:type IV secretory pathway VirB2 component (pilin)